MVIMAHVLLYTVQCPRMSSVADPTLDGRSVGCSGSLPETLYESHGIGFAVLHFLPKIWNAEHDYNPQKI